MTGELVALPGSRSERTRYGGATVSARTGFRWLGSCHDVRSLLILKTAHPGVDVPALSARGGRAVTRGCCGLLPNEPPAVDRDDRAVEVVRCRRGQEDERALEIVRCLGQGAAAAMAEAGADITS